MVIEELRRYIDTIEGDLSKGILTDRKAPECVEEKLREIETWGRTSFLCDFRKFVDEVGGRIRKFDTDVSKGIMEEIEERISQKEPYSYYELIDMLTTYRQLDNYVTENDIRTEMDNEIETLKKRMRTRRLIERLKLHKEAKELAGLSGWHYFRKKRGNFEIRKKLVLLGYIPTYEDPGYEKDPNQLDLNMLLDALEKYSIDMGYGTYAGSIRAAVEEARGSSN